VSNKKLAAEALAGKTKPTGKLRQLARPDVGHDAVSLAQDLASWAEHQVSLLRLAKGEQREEIARRVRGAWMGVYVPGEKPSEANVRSILDATIRGWGKDELGRDVCWRHPSEDPDVVAEVRRWGSDDYGEPGYVEAEEQRVLAAAVRMVRQRMRVFAGLVRYDKLEDETIIAALRTADNRGGRGGVALKFNDALHELHRQLGIATSDDGRNDRRKRKAKNR